MPETVKKYYIMQRLNATTKTPVFFFNEMGVKTPAKQFNEFTLALKAYIDIAKNLKEKTILYFHKDGSYRGFTLFKQAILIADKISKLKINNLVIIDELEKNKLISPISVNSQASEATMAMAVTALDLDNKAKDAKFILSNTQKAIDEVVINDLKADLPGFQVEIIKTVVNENKLDIYYTISKDGKTKSSPFIKSMTGFGTQKIELSTARSIYEDMNIKTQVDANLNKRFQVKAWIFFTTLTVMIALSIILLVLVLIKK